MKAEKYGDKILEQINKYGDLDDELKENHRSEGRPSKRLKTKKALVLIESSDDDA